MKHNHFIFLLIFIFLAMSMKAQLIINDNEFENFGYNIKQIDEFILRFNLRELLILPDQSTQYERDNRILLFDKQYYLANKNSLDEFISAVEKQETMLHFNDSTWYAIADCNVSFQGRKSKITLILQTELVKDDIYKWSITDAKGDILQLQPISKSDRLRLLPTDNEVNFIALQSVTTSNAKNITHFNSKKHKTDELSVFNSLVYYKQLKVDNVHSLSYCFTQVNGYRFYVKNFTRDEKNAGWLIYDVQKCDDEENILDNETASDSAALQLVKLFYNRLSEYSNNPASVTMARNIKTMFADTRKASYFFGTKQIYDDIDVCIGKLPSIYAYASVSDYLNSIDNLSQEDIVLKYEISNFKIIQDNGNETKATYKVTIKDKNDVMCEYNAVVTISNHLIIDIVHWENDYN